MKKLINKHLIFTILLFGAFLNAVNGQSPQMVSYQALVRGNDGSPLINTPVTVVLTVRSTSPSGPNVYSESHSTVTNEFGLVNLSLGGGTTTDNFSLIDWAAGPYFLKVDINGKEMGTSQMISVPYSLYSQRSANGLLGTSPNYYIENAKIGIGTKTPLSTLSVTGSTPQDSAIFEVKNNNGKTVFAVYNEGVRIYIDESLKASKGGFAIGGLTGAKSTFQEYLRVTGDETRVFVNNASMAKGIKGGFAIGGFDAVKGPSLNFVSLTPTNSLLGYSAGDSITTGTKNFFAGYQAGITNKTGSQNVFIGDQAGFKNNSNTNIFIGTLAGYSNKTGFGSVIIGDNAGYNSNGSRNIFIGRDAGKENTTGMDNVYIGSYSGARISAAQYNTFVGVEAGNFSTQGWNNVYLGHRAGYVSNGTNNVVVGDLAGSNNQIYTGTPSSFNNSVFLGASSGSKQQSGAGNTYLGTYAGRNNLTGSGNVFIGTQAGQNELGSNKLYISNDYTSTPLIYGEFYPFGDPVYQKVRINGKLEVANVPTGSGSAVNVDANGQLVKVSSSLRYKKEIADLDVKMNDFMLLRPVTFSWNNLTATPGKEDFGLIAEEVFQSVPSLSVLNNDGSIEGVNYHAVNMLTLGVVQKQQTEITELELKLAESRSEVSDLKERIKINEEMIQKILSEMQLSERRIKRSLK